MRCDHISLMEPPARDTDVRCGHATLPAASVREDAVLDLLRKRFGHVSAERVLSGMGLENLYHAIGVLDRIEVPPRNAAQITNAALEDGADALG
jgi:glucokinase